MQVKERDGVRWRRGRAGAPGATHRRKAGGAGAVRVYLAGDVRETETVARLLEERHGFCRAPEPPTGRCPSPEIATAIQGRLVVGGPLCARGAERLTAAGFVGVAVTAGRMPFVAASGMAGLPAVALPEPPCGHGAPAWGYLLGLGRDPLAAAELTAVLVAALQTAVWLRDPAATHA